MGVAGQREVGEIDEGFAAPIGGYLSTARESPDDLCHLDVQEVRGAQRFVDREEALPALLADGGPEQHLHDSGGVDDGHRESRSRRRASVGDSERLGTLLDASLGGVRPRSGVLRPPASGSAGNRRATGPQSQRAP